METKYYNESYLVDSSENIGAMFEYAVNYGFTIQTIWQWFINSIVAKQIEIGNPKYLVGYSGKELLDIILKEKIINKNEIKESKELLSYNIYYWAGWAITQFQYNTGYPFYYIDKYLPIDKILLLYDTLHEADIDKFIDVAKTYFIKKENDTNLKKIRTAAKTSQRELSIKSDVDLRSIQMYEQKRNDINKAQAETLLKISKVLGCRIEDLLELK